MTTGWVIAELEKLGMVWSGQDAAWAACAMTEARRDELDAIDPGRCPVRDTRWQRCFRLVQNRIHAGGVAWTRSVHCSSSRTAHRK
ncbi:hypothetical protein [Streptomyces sp. BE133]|uniref:hypothetical protein n=1 Tax=Streptomyces sp. BE133 TaxID=3002523 RepID=UPI002E78EE74|nr:hypothetical protein [Streptomyces sp. BE133]MEE1808188.1 hypothetical protein [Streptomyces sp. BE133]